MSQQPIEQIEISLRASELNLRKNALDELGKFSADVAIPVLQRLSQEPDFALRRLAVMGLGNHRTNESFQALQRIIEKDEDANVLAEAANSIFEFGEQAIPVLSGLFKRSQNWLVRQTVISLLVETTSYADLLEIAKIAITDPTQTVKEAGILALGQILKSPLQKQALEILTQLSYSPDWRTRWRVAIALQHSQAPQAKQLISQLQQDEHYRVVAAALEVATGNN